MSKELNYREEVAKLQEYENTAGNWFKPEAGQYKLIILNSPQIIEKDFGNNGQSEIKRQLRLNIEIDNKPFTWDIGIGQTTNSVYGQLMLVGKEKGTLVGEQLTLLVKRGKDKNDYTIMEALPLMGKK